MMETTSPLLCWSSPAGTGAPSAGVQGFTGHRGRGPGYPHSRELVLAQGGRGQSGTAESAELLPVSWSSGDLFSQRQGRETHHGTRLFPFSGESRRPFMRSSCSVLLTQLYLLVNQMFLLKNQKLLLPVNISMTNRCSWFTNQSRMCRKYL